MVTIGFSPHRVEALPYSTPLMERHQIIVLEEAPHPMFDHMIEGRVPIDEYLPEIDSEFPKYDRLLYSGLRELRKNGAKILQIEPYLEKLIKIHERFSQGKKPEEIMRVSGLRDIYEAEKRATGSLITYYARSIENDFDKITEAVKAFAMADAERLRLRSQLRAQAISALDRGKDIYVESGYIHYPLYQYLRCELGQRFRIKIYFLLQPIFKKLRCKRRNMGPGDILTLHYSLGSRIKEGTADLLAARSLVFIKLIEKNELIPRHSDAPHCEDEDRANKMVDCLGYEDCREIYWRIRFKSRDEALRIVTDYLNRK